MLTSHAVSEHAVRFVNAHVARGDDAPFFMYVSHTAAHWPLHALEKDIAKYKGRFDAGYESIREARLGRIRKLGLLDNAILGPVPQAWEEITEETRAWEARCMEVYAAMIDSMHQGIGRLIEALRTNGQYDNTPMEGRSLLPGFAKDRDDKRVLLWEHYHNAALLKGDWKLVRLREKTPGKDMENGWKLYNIGMERGELLNLAETHPEKALWQEHARRNLVFPMPDDKK